MFIRWGGLFEYNLPEEFRTVEARFRQVDGIPRQEVWRVLQVSAFVEIGTSSQSFEAFQLMAEERFLWDAKSQLPTAFSHSFFKRSLSE